MPFKMFATGIVPLKIIFLPTTLDRLGLACRNASLKSVSLLAPVAVLVAHRFHSGGTNKCFSFASDLTFAGFVSCVTTATLGSAFVSETT